jgi:phosphatidyl-myo-inositol dimannoside synthase
LDKIPENYSLFVSRLLISYGGISDYTDNFARQLHRRKRLRRVITPFPGGIERDYDIEVFDLKPERKPSYFDRWKPGSKIVTLFYYVRLYISAYRGLKKLKLKKANEYLIFTEYYTFQFDIIIFCARILKIKYAIIFHGLDLICEKKQRFTHFAKNFKKAGFIIYNSEATKQLAIDLLQARHERTMILNPGIDAAALERYLNPENCMQGFRNIQDEIIFTTISRLVNRKGIDLAIRMVSELAKSGMAVRYFIGGGGEEEDRLKALIKELHAETYIYFLGEISNEEKYKLLEISDFFLFPNHSSANNDFEGFGISCIEASFFGNVIIGGKHGGVKEAVVDQETGFLFDFDDPLSVEKALMTIRTCIENPELRKKIKMQGMEYVRAKYDWNRLTGHFVQTEQEFFTV